MDVLNGSRLCVVCFVWVLFAVFCFGAGHPVFCNFTCSPTARSVDRPCHELDRHSLKKKAVPDTGLIDDATAPSTVPGLAHFGDDVIPGDTGGNVTGMAAMQASTEAASYFCIGCAFLSRYLKPNDCSARIPPASSGPSMT